MFEDDSRNGDEDDAASQDEEDSGRDSDFSLADLPVLLLFQVKKNKPVTIRRIKLLKLQFKVHNVAEAKKTYSEDLLHSQNALHKDGSQLVSDSRQQKPE